MPLERMVFRSLPVVSIVLKNTSYHSIPALRGKDNQVYNNVALSFLRKQVLLSNYKQLSNVSSCFLVNYAICLQFLFILSLEYLKIIWVYLSQNAFFVAV